MSQPHIKTCIIYDIDGTLADISHRKHFIEGDVKDWASFNANCVSDEPIPEMVDRIKLDIEEEKHWVFLMTGRSAEYRDITEQWMTKHGIYHDGLLMRNEGDYRPDTEVKKQFGRLIQERGLEIIEVYEDRPSVIRMWRSIGVPVTDVGDGVEF